MRISGCVTHIVNVNRRQLLFFLQSDDRKEDEKEERIGKGVSLKYRIDIGRVNCREFQLNMLLIVFETHLRSSHTRQALHLFSVEKQNLCASNDLPLILMTLKTDLRIVFPLVFLNEGKK